MLRATFLDLDGTLVDSEPLHCASVVETLASVGISLAETDYYGRYLSLTDRATFDQAIADFRRADLARRTGELVAEKERRFAARLARGVPLLGGASDFVAEAASRGPIALVTGARRHEALALVDQPGLRGRFAVIVTADDVKRGKPDAEPYRVAFEHVREHFGRDLRPGECLAVEDAPLGVRAARAAGLRALAITTSRPVEDFTEADVVFPSLAAADWRAIEAIF